MQRGDLLEVWHAESKLTLRRVWREHRRQPRRRLHISPYISSLDRRLSYVVAPGKIYVYGFGQFLTWSFGNGPDIRSYISAFYTAKETLKYFICSENACSGMMPFLELALNFLSGSSDEPLRIPEFFLRSGHFQHTEILDLRDQLISGVVNGVKWNRDNAAEASRRRHQSLFAMKLRETTKTFTIQDKYNIKL